MYFVGKSIKEYILLLNLASVGINICMSFLHKKYLSREVENKLQGSAD